MIDLDAIPYHRFLGISIELPSGDQGVLGRMRFDDHLIGNPRLPALHGGTLGALLESVAILQVMTELEPEGLPKTINITVDYLRPGRPQETFARARIEKRGRRVVNVRAFAWQDDPDEPIAVATGHFLIKARSES